MSLEYAAEAVRSKGRGDDTMLVHMTPGEVKGLQQLAMAYGGSLSTNPETGLPEAGFLKSLLPTLIGVGLAATGMGPLAAGLTVGGIETVRTGDIGRGLMAGLGAYGGAGFGTSLAAAAPAETTIGMAADGTALMTPGGAANVANLANQPVMTNLSTMGSGLSNIMSSGGDAARAAALRELGGSATSAALRGTAALAGPLSQPAPMPEVEGVEYNYDGPYKPTERQVRYPGPDRDPTDSSEFQYFDVVNPSPGFEPIASSTPLPENTYGPDAPRFAGIPVEMATDPERMRDYQQNPNLYSFAEGGATVATAPPEGYVSGQDAEFVYGFTPMAAKSPEIQQEVAVYNPVARERYGYTPSDGPQPPSTGSVDMGYIPGLAANIGRAYNSLSGLEKALIPGAMTAGALADSAMRDKGYAYNPTTGDYEQKAYMGGGSEGYTTIGQDVSMQGGRANKNEEDPSETFFRRGGEVDMHNNGFVVDAHTVSEVGNGSSNAGMERFAQIGGQPIMGPGDGTSDSIPANIDGMQPAMVARDEVYMPPDAVATYGGGSLKVGEKKLYALMEQARKSRKKNGRGQSTGLKQLVG